MGVMLYELLTGTKPFRGQNVEETLRQIRTASPVPPSVKRPDLPPLLDAVIGRFLKKWPGDRYANWAEAALDLANVGRMSVYRQSIPDSEKFTALKSASLTAGFDDGELWNTVRHAR